MGCQLERPMAPFFHVRGVAASQHQCTVMITVYGAKQQDIKRHAPSKTQPCFTPVATM